MRTLVVATRNPGKLREIRRILSDLPLRLASLAEFPEAPPVEEDGSSYRENAEKKARAAARQTGCWAMGEDSGIEVDALGGRPGIHSARYAGGDRENNARLLHELQEVPGERRTARYRCVIVVVDEAGRERAFAEGTCEGRIGREEKGNGGFGYDPLFVLPDRGGRTMAEVGDDIKNQISHRARALERLRPLLAGALDPVPGSS